MVYQADESRYESMPYAYCGHSGLQLPRISLGLWQNFAGDKPFNEIREMLCYAFDQGVTHFDLANNYGPPPGAAEENVGRMLQRDFAPYRDELVISTKAGYRMQPGPYGFGGSRKYLLGSLDASLKRLGLDYVDIFYSHRFDPDTPLEETVGALASAVHRGKALYVGISSYSANKTAEAAAMLRERNVPCLIHQPSYSMLNRWVETDGLLDVIEREGMGCIVFSPLAQGLLTGKYLDGIPAGSRVRTGRAFSEDFLTEENLAKVRALNAIAQRRGQTLAQMAIAWVLRDRRVTSTIIGASRVSQIADSLSALERLEFSGEELDEIERYATDGGLNIWRASSDAG